jgi:hypothetical protein
MSSLERVELLSELEDRYQVELDEETFSKLTTTRELDAWLQQPQAVHDVPLSEWARSAPVTWLRNVFQYAIALPLFRSTLSFTVTGLENLESLKPR